jgi:hypothetical protein
MLSLMVIVVEAAAYAVTASQPTVLLENMLVVLARTGLPMRAVGTISDRNDTWTGTATVPMMRAEHDGREVNSVLTC